MKPFKPTRRPTREEIEDAAALELHLARHKRLKPPPYDFGPFRAKYHRVSSESIGVLFVAWPHAS